MFTKYKMSIFNSSKVIEEVPKSPYCNDVPMSPTLDLWTQNRYASTQCRGLLLCQVSSHSDQGFSFYRANIVCTHISRHTPCTYPYTQPKFPRWSTYTWGKFSHGRPRML